MIERYLDRLAEALAAAGVRGRPARRLLAEARDHLLEVSAEHGEREAVARFGAAEAIARRVAAQLATGRTRKAAYGSFAALALTATAYGAAGLLVDRAGGWPDLFAAEHEGLGVLALGGMFFFPQVAFVCGCLALLRARRLCRSDALPTQELSVLRARATIALAAGALTAGSLALFAVEFRDAPPLAGRTPGIVLALAASVVLPLAVAAVALARSSRPQAIPAAAPSNLFDDLGPVFRLGLLRRLPAHPWRFASLTAAAVGSAAFVAGWIAEGDPRAGLLRGGVEAVAILAGFAALGRRLALR